MKPPAIRAIVGATVALAVLWACPFDDSLREYLHVQFWLPFSKGPSDFARKNVRRSTAPFAGMVAVNGSPALQSLRNAYRKIANPEFGAEPITIEPSPLRKAVEAARADASLSPKDREEVDLIDAKIDMRAGSAEEPHLLESAKTKLRKFLRTAKTPAYLSEARGWLARVHYLLGEQTAAGKFYLDELNRNGSFLSRETILNSLTMTYRYDGGDQLIAHLDEYFDTPEHAAFAIQLATNPHWDRSYLHEQLRYEHQGPADRAANSYTRIKTLLASHTGLLESDSGANALAILSMRTALRMGDPPEALKISAAIPSTSAIRAEPDFLWMLASAHFLSREYPAAEKPLRDLFASPLASPDDKAADAYGLCGVYRKLGNAVEQLRYALWLRATKGGGSRFSELPDLDDRTIYWAASGWDLSLLLENEAPVDALRAFLQTYPAAPEIRLVKYALAVRLTRENQYEEAAQIYESINANRRGPRMRQLAALYREANRTDLPAAPLRQAKYKLAEFIAAHSNGIYFNDSLWSGLQGYALISSEDSSFTAAERDSAIAAERKLRDDQEELWRAYVLLRDIAREEGKTALGRKAARLAVTSLRRLSSRFGRPEEIRKGEIELWAWLRQ